MSMNFLEVAYLVTLTHYVPLIVYKSVVLGNHVSLGWFSF
jgi:hypothetical protein